MSNIIHPYGEKDPYAIVELISSTQVHSDKFNVDQMPALAARVSHAGDKKTGLDEDADKKLMQYLADHKHMSVFEHQTATFRVVAPLFVFREWHRHRTQSYNEVSMRYTDDPVGKFYYPSEFRKQATRNKQSSAGNLEGRDAQVARGILSNAYKNSLQAYNDLLDIGVCREQARSVVPVGNYSEMYATANLRNWFAFYLLRHSQDAQKEIRDYACAIDEILSEIWTNSWSVLKKTCK